MTPSLLTPAPSLVSRGTAAVPSRRISVPSRRSMPAPRSGDLMPSPPLYAGLAASLQRLIEQDTLRPGHRVPSVRRMSL